MTNAEENYGILQGKRMAFVGKLASMSRRDAGQLVRGQGATVLERPDASADLLVVGEEELPLAEGEGPETSGSTSRPGRRPKRAIWKSLPKRNSGSGWDWSNISRTYTGCIRRPCWRSLLGVPVAVIRRWHRRGLIVPVREVRRLPYFDFQEVAAARRLAELLAAGVSPRDNRKEARMPWPAICPAWPGRWHSFR